MPASYVLFLNQQLKHADVANPMVCAIDLTRRNMFKVGGLRNIVTVHVKSICIRM
jgi:hypothetical protein